MNLNIAETVQKFFGRIKGILTDPIGVFNDAREEGFGEALKYFFGILGILFAILVLLLIVGTATSGILDVVLADPDIGAVSVTEGFTALIFVFILLFIYMFIGGLIVLGIASLLIQLGVTLTGREGILADMMGFHTKGKDLTETVKAVAYSATPFVFLGFLLSWIPISILGIPISILVGIVWSLILCVIGIRELHGIPTGQAAVAVIIALSVILIVVLWVLTKFLKISLRDMIPSR